MYSLKTYLNGLNLQNISNISNVSAYLSNVSKSDSNINNIKIYLNALNLPNTSVLLSLMNYLNGITFQTGNPDLYLLNTSILRNITNFLNNSISNDDKGLQKLKVDFDQINLQNIDLTKVINYLKNLNISNLTSKDQLILANIKKYLNYLNIPQASILIQLLNIFNTMSLPPLNNSTPVVNFPSDQTQEVSFGSLFDLGKFGSCN
jgi:hypothetical protein